MWSSNLTPGHIAGKSYNPKRYTHPYAHSGTIYNSQDIVATKVSSDRWMDREDVVSLYRGILVSHKREWNHANCSNIDGPRNYQTKWSKPDRERQISYDILICGI